MSSFDKNWRKNKKKDPDRKSPAFLNIYIYI